MSRVQSFCLTVTMMLCMLSILGCRPSAPDVHEVQGVITLDGKPLDRATVIFQPASGRYSTGVTDELGRYRLQFSNERFGALAGKHDVSITSEVLFEEGKPKSGRREILPARYHQRSELTADVLTRDNSIDFELTSK